MINDIFTIEISANVVAWYGAVVATAGFIFSAYSVWRDSARLKISISRKINLYNTNGLYKKNVDYIGVTVVNRGRRPIKISSAELLILGNKNRLFLTDSLFDHRIQTITEDEPKKQFFVEEKDVDFDKIYCVVVKDGAKRVYKKYTKKFPTILKVYYKIRKNYDKK